MDFETNLNHRLAAVAGQGKRLVYRVIAEAGLTITPDQWAVLYYLWKEDGLTIGELVGHTKKDFANVTRVVERLVRDGYVRKVKNPEDKRSYRVFSLSKADGIKTAIEAVFHTMSALSLKGVSEREQKFVLSVLAKIERNVAEQLERRNAE